MKKLRYFLRGFGLLAILLTIFPFIPIDHWSIRVFDFPHVQLTVLTLAALVSYLITFDYMNVSDYVFVGMLAVCFIFQGGKVFPYTGLSPFEMNDASDKGLNSLSIYTSNVLQDNDDASRLLSDMKNNDADLVLYTETDEKWQNMLSNKMKINYPYNIEVPLDNTYGMMLYSKFPFHDSNVNYLIEDTIPSITVKLLLPSNDTIQIIAIHPAPPTPQHNPSSVDRDAEMMKVARMARNSRFPVIVMGDFNDVAWSQTTSLFQKASGLLDLRKGRGLYNTFNAKNWLMRWPLDHIFTSPDFRLIEVQRGEKVGSDHFPFYVNLSIETALAADQRLSPPSQEVLERAFDQIENESEQN